MLFTFQFCLSESWFHLCSTPAGSALCGLHLEYMTGLLVFFFFLWDDRLLPCVRQPQLNPDITLLLLSNVSSVFLCLMWVSGKLCTFCEMTSPPSQLQIHAAAASSLSKTFLRQKAELLAGIRVCVDAILMFYFVLR